MSALLEVEGLRTHFFTRAGVVKAVDDVSLSLERGKVLGLVGESGSGKSVTGYSILGLVDPPGRIVGGAIRFDGSNLLDLGEAEMEAVRGNDISMIFQERRDHRESLGFSTSRSWSATRLIAMIVSMSATPG